MYVLKPKYAVFWLWLCWYSKFLGKIVDFGGIVLTENHVSTPHLRREVQSAAINTTVYTVNAKHDYVLALESTTAYNRRARVPFSPHFISAKCSRNRFTCVERERERVQVFTGEQFRCLPQAERQAITWQTDTRNIRKRRANTNTQLSVR